LKSVNPTDISFKLQDCGTIRLEEVTFEPLYAGQQLLSLEVSSVLIFILHNLEIEEAFQVNGSNIKEFLISDVTFSHIPENGLIFDRTDKLSIKDSVFKRISPASITAVGSKDILILNNQFNINAVEVIKASKGSKLYISCNRLLAEPLNPECVTTTTVTESPPTSPTVTRESYPSEVYQPPEVSEKQIEESWVTVELVIGVTVGGFLVLFLLIIVIIFIMCNYKKKGKTKTKDSTISDCDTENLCNEPQSVTETEEAKVDLNDEKESDTEEDILLRQGNKETVVVDETRPRFSSPVWLSEIQDNKVFNKQKSMNNNPKEDVKQSSVVNDNIETPMRKGRPFPVRSISEIIDDDSDLNSLAEEENETLCDQVEKNNSEQIKLKTPETDL